MWSDVSRQAFLYDKFTRLGVPYFFVTLVMMPLHNLFLATVVLGEPYTYFPDPGPAWFLAWLLIFNTSYVLLARESATPIEQSLGDPSATVARPGLGWLMLVSLATGAVMAVLCVATGQQPQINPPPIPFFWGGFCFVYQTAHFWNSVVCCHNTPAPKGAGSHAMQE